MTATRRRKDGLLRALGFRRAPNPETAHQPVGRESVPPAAAQLNDATLVHQAVQQFYARRRDIETDLDDEAAAARFMDRVIAQWRALGEAEPFWSNDTRDEFKRENLTERAVEEFYAGGRGVMSVIDAFESRSKARIANGICVELGCGVGKHTHALAQRFERVFALDVAAGGLAVCAQRMKTLGLDNVTTVLLTSPEDLARCGDSDFFLSLSVLQHNPPPLQKLLIETALKRLRPSGHCLFQTPDWLENYTFSNRRFLEAGEAMFDLHCLPKTDVLAILDRQDMRLLDFAPDVTLAAFGSYTYFAQKR